MYKIIYINLDRSRLRKREITNELSKYFKGFQIEREPAVEGNSLDLKEMKDTFDSRSFYYLKDSNHRRLLNEDIHNNGEIGCSLSHINVWKKLLSDNTVDYYLICEDDILFNLDSNPVEIISDIIKKYPNFDFFSLIYLSKRGNNEEDALGNIKINHPFYGAQCYLLSKKGAKILVDNAFPLTSQIDAYIGYVSHYQNLQSYMLKEPIGIDRGFSEINHEGDKYCVLCSLPYEYEVEIKVPKNYNDYGELKDFSSNELISDPLHLKEMKEKSRIQEANLYIKFVFIFMIVIIALLSFIIYTYSRK